MPARDVAAERPPDAAGAQPPDRDAGPLAVVDHRARDPRMPHALARHADPARPGHLGDPRPRGPASTARIVLHGCVGPGGHFSTPVTTTPRMNARWASRNTITGTAIAISAEAWMSVGCEAYNALYCWIAIDS